MHRKQHAIAHVKQYQMLSDVMRLEPRAVHGIIDSALSDATADNYWEQYSELKKRMSTVAGWDARYQAISSSEYYSVMLNFILWLLDISHERLVLSDSPDREVPEEELIAPTEDPVFEDEVIRKNGLADLGFTGLSF
jgi:hypothetical protein